MKKENWKEIIDPCFDEIIKTYLSFIRVIKGLPNEGLFHFPEEINKTILENSNSNSTFTADDEEHRDTSQ